MKKCFLTALVVSALTSSAAFAGNTGEIRFVGAVSAATCDFKTIVNGAAQDTISLGTIGLSEEMGPDVLFEIRPADKSECAQKTNATVSMQSTGLIAQGLKNMGGTAKGYAVELWGYTAPNNGGQVFYTSNNQSAEFTSGSQDGILAYKLGARLAKRVTLDPNEQYTAGSVLAAVSYSITYQ